MNSVGPEPIRKTLTFKAEFWLEEKENGWHVGRRVEGRSGFEMFGPCDSKLVAEILKAELMDEFETSAQRAIDNFKKR